MKNKTEQVEIMTKALISRCHGLYSQEALGNEIIDFTDRVVKLLTTPDVSNRRELLIAFIEWYREDDMSKFSPEHLADWYLKAINCC